MEDTSSLGAERSLPKNKNYIFNQLIGQVSISFEIEKRQPKPEFLVADFRRQKLFSKELPMFRSKRSTRLVRMIVL